MMAPRDQRKKWKRRTKGGRVTGRGKYVISGVMWPGPDVALQTNLAKGD